MKLSLVKSLIVILTLLALAFSASGVTPAHAASFTVTNASDTIDNWITGTLRQAIDKANANPGTDTITFAENYTITLNSELPAITSNIIIKGNGVANTILQANAASGVATYAIFNVSSEGSLSLNDLTVQNGGNSGINNYGMVFISNSSISNNYSTSGGGVYSVGIYSSIYIRNSTIEHNTATTGEGGGIYNDSGYIDVSNCTIYRNSAKQSGGGIYNYGGTVHVASSLLSHNAADSGSGIFNEGGGTLTVSTSTISHGDSATSGGGIDNYNGTATITNSTFSYNSATAGYGGGIFNNGTLTTTNSTLVYNYAPNGGGIDNWYSGTVTVKNSTLSGNSSGNGDGISNGGVLNYANTIIANSVSGIDCATSGTIGTNANNLVENGGCSASLSGDPKLGALASNGGSTQTFALLTGSPAINAGNDGVCAAAPVGNLDQRGVTRPIGAHCDIGAYEAPLNATATPTPKPTPTPTRAIVTLTLNSVAAQDGWVLESSETSGKGGALNSAAATFNLGDNAQKKQYRGILSFRTGSLPDNAVITSLTLKVKKSAIIGGGNPVVAFKGFIVDIKNGVFGAAALQVGDFQAAASQSSGPFVLAPVGGWYSLNLTGAKPYVNKGTTSSGLTQLRLCFNLDDNNNAVANYLSLYSGNAPVAANRPQLVITYYVP